MLSMRTRRDPLLRTPAVFTLLVGMTLVVAGTVVVTGGAAQADSAPAAASTAVTASDDGYVTASEPTARSGGATTLVEGTAKTDRVVYLKFSVGAVPANTPVAVELYSERASTIPAQLSTVADVSWQQKDLAWNNRPAVGARVVSVAGMPLDNWVTFDVTNVVKGPGTYSFAIDSPAGGASNNTFTATESSKGNGPRLVVGPTAPPNSLKVPASDDAYAVASSPATKTGGNTTLLEGTSETTRVVYLKFTVSSLPKNIPVQLQLFSERASKIPAQLRVVANTSWTQATLDWNSRPPVGAQAAWIAGTPLNNWVTFDVTSLITRPGTYSFAVESPAGGASNNLFSATEKGNGNGPRMVIATDTPPPIAKVKPFFVIYYLWWSTYHWNNKLNVNYPYTAKPSPLPATVDASGCNAKTKYVGNQLTDVSDQLVYQQDGKDVILNDVRLAASMGVTGFAVNWRGDGTTTQTPTSDSYNKRLQATIDAVKKVNAEGIPFKVMLNYKGSANIVPVPEIKNDIAYFMKQYGNEPVFDHTYSNKPEVIYAGTWKYADSTLAQMADIIRPSMYFMGDEKPTTWTTNRARYLDGDAYYWSSQNPYQNPQSFEQLQDLSNRIHSEKNPDGSTKTYLAPIIPGYNAQLLTGSATCVPRDGGQTLSELYHGNLTSNPDGWDVISWNEITEGSYIVPLTRYGPLYTDKLKSVIANGG